MEIIPEYAGNSVSRDSIPDVQSYCPQNFTSDDEDRPSVQTPASGATTALAKEFDVKPDANFEAEFDGESDVDEADNHPLDLMAGSELTADSSCDLTADSNENSVSRSDNSSRGSQEAWEAERGSLPPSGCSEVSLPADIFHTAEVPAVSSQEIASIGEGSPNENSEVNRLPGSRAGFRSDAVSSSRSLEPPLDETDPSIALAIGETGSFEAGSEGFLEGLRSISVSMTGSGPDSGPGSVPSSTRSGITGSGENGLGETGSERILRSSRSGSVPEPARGSVSHRVLNGSLDIAGSVRSFSSRSDSSPRRGASVQVSWRLSNGVSPSNGTSPVRLGATGSRTVVRNSGAASAGSSGGRVLHLPAGRVTPVGLFRRTAPEVRNEWPWRGEIIAAEGEEERGERGRRVEARESESNREIALNHLRPNVSINSFPRSSSNASSNSHPSSSAVTNTASNNALNFLSNSVPNSASNPVSNSASNFQPLISNSQTLLANDFPRQGSPRTPRPPLSLPLPPSRSSSLAHARAERDARPGEGGGRRDVSVARMDGRGERGGFSRLFSSFRDRRRRRERPREPSSTTALSASPSLSALSFFSFRVRRREEGGRERERGREGERTGLRFLTFYRSLLSRREREREQGERGEEDNLSGRSDSNFVNNTQNTRINTLVGNQSINSSSHINALNSFRRRERMGARGGGSEERTERVGEREETREGGRERGSGTSEEETPRAVENSSESANDNNNNNNNNVNNTLSNNINNNDFFNANGGEGFLRRRALVEAVFLESIAEYFNQSRNGPGESTNQIRTNNHSNNNNETAPTQSLPRATSHGDNRENLSFSGEGVSEEGVISSSSTSLSSSLSSSLPPPIASSPFRPSSLRTLLRERDRERERERDSFNSTGAHSVNTFSASNNHYNNNTHNNNNNNSLVSTAGNHNSSGASSLAFGGFFSPSLSFSPSPRRLSFSPSPHLFLFDEEEEWTYEQLLELDRFNVPRGLKPKELWKLNRRKISNDEVPFECLICLSEAKCAELVTEMPCAHLFHDACLTPWLKTHRTCPICRSEVPNSN